MSHDGPLGAFEEVVLLAVIRTDTEAFGMEVRREIERHWRPSRKLARRETACGAGST